MRASQETPVEERRQEVSYLPLVQVERLRELGAVLLRPAGVSAHVIREHPLRGEFHGHPRA